MCASEIYDRAEALQRIDGDEELFAELSSLFVAESAGYCAAIEDAMNAADAATLRREAHTVKSMLATFAYESGRELAFQLERLAASGSLEGAESLTSQVVAAIKSLAEALSKEVG